MTRSLRVIYAIGVSLAMLCEGQHACIAQQPKGHLQGDQSTGTAYISELQGNTKDAGDHINISGTNAWVRMYVKNSWPVNSHACKAYLAGSMLADYDNIKVNPCFSGQDMLLSTDAAGSWQSAGDKGYVKFDSSAELVTGTEGNLKIKLFPYDETPFLSKWEGTEKPVRLYNKAYVLSNRDILWGSTSANYVHERCEAMNHSASPVESENETHNYATIISNIQTYTVFYIVSHGNHEYQTYFMDCLDDNINVVHASDVQVMAEQKTAQPYYNLVHLDTCYSSDEQDMAKAFGILDPSGGARPDRAFIGWVGVSYSFPGNVNWTKEVWSLLSEGTTVKYAVDQATFDHREIGTARVYGDYNTTLHSVYSGTIDPAP